jgi:hypothetical protein
VERPGPGRGQGRAPVQAGWVTLEGEVEYDYQGREVGKAVRHVRGVTGIINNTVVRAPAASPDPVEAIIEQALESARPRRPPATSGSAILTAGAQLSLVGRRLPLAPSMIELGVNAGVVALSVALVLVLRFARLDRA